MVLESVLVSFFYKWLISFPSTTCKEIVFSTLYIRTSFVKASAWNAGDPGSIPGSGRSLEKEMATHSSTLAWRIPWREVPGRLKSTVSQRVGHSFPGGSEGKVSACNAGDLGLIPGSGRLPGKGNGNPLQYSCLENPMDREVWWTTVHDCKESDTTERFHFHLSKIRCP